MNKLWKEKALEKIIDPRDLAEKIKVLKNEGCTIATLNGSFDLLHAGHLHILYEASKKADVLIVALNSDASIKKYKNPSRPIVPLEYRLELVSALEFVSFVTWFEETTPCRLLEMIQPHIHVNGSEYGTDCIESKVVKKSGGELYLVERIPGLSTTTIVKKIKELCD